jgi:hypothetical protein
MIVIVVIHTLIASRRNPLYRVSVALSRTNTIKETQLIEP